MIKEKIKLIIILQILICVLFTLGCCQSPSYVYKFLREKYPNAKIYITNDKEIFILYFKDKNEIRLIGITSLQLFGSNIYSDQLIDLNDINNIILQKNDPNGEI